MLATDEINAALRLIGGGTFAAGETPSDSETADAAVAFNQLLEAWSIEQLTVYQIKNFQQALSASTQAYTMGTGGVFNTARPVKIQTPGIIIGGIRHDLTPLSPAEWAAIPELGLTGQLPRGMWNDNAFPLLTLRFTPIPSGTPTFDAYLWQPFSSVVAMSGTCTTTGTAVTWVSGSQFDQTLVGVSFVVSPLMTYTVSAVTDATHLILATSAGNQSAVPFIASSTFALPPAYGRAIRYNLAAELAAEFDRPVPDNVAAIAMSSKAAIVALNTSNDVAKLPSDLPPPPDAGQ